ncbi:primase-helicase family protein [Xanthobacter autotrophicus DSM 597]|uniref:primase-helicase family protein n=1 Tax=Xanthobacter wiegelii TaxID=3119913 RepID=UPI003728EDB1
MTDVSQHPASGPEAVLAIVQAAAAGLSQPDPAVPGEGAAPDFAAEAPAPAADDGDGGVDDGRTWQEGEEVRGARPLGFDVDDMNDSYALVLMGSKAVVAKEQPSGPVEDRLRIVALDAFMSWFANTYTEVVAPDGKVKGMTWGKRWHTHPRRRSYAGIEFFPNPDGAASTPGYLNLWRGFTVTPRAGGSYGIFRDHLLTNVCEGDEALFRWVFGWFAHLVQRPRERVGTALVMRGKMGTGKTKVGEVMGSLFQAHYFAVDDPRYVTGQFNAHMASCLLLQAEEAVWAGDKAAEGRLKGLVTSKFQMIEAKGIDPIRLDNFVRLLMTSNEDWVVPAGKDERRFCVLDVNPRCAQDTTYFREMDEELAAGGREALLHDLLAFDLSQVDLRKIPRTGALLEQKLRSLDSVDSWWFERVMAGATTSGGEQWVGVIPIVTLFDDYIAVAEKVGVRRKSEMTAFGIKMQKLVPGLARVKRMIDYAPGVSKRVWCYQLPTLSACRDAIEADLGQDIGWSREDEQEAGYADDPLP